MSIIPSADLVLLMTEWQGAVSDIVNRLRPTKPAVLLEVLVVLPEEVSSRHLRWVCGFFHEFLSVIKVLLGVLVVLLGDIYCKITRLFFNMLVTCFYELWIVYLSSFFGCFDFQSLEGLHGLLLKKKVQCLLLYFSCFRYPEDGTFARSSFQFGRCKFECVETA